MREIEAAFGIEVGGKLVRIVEYEVGSKRIFHVNFDSAVKPLVITIAISHKDEKFWTSIPEGRQKEAENFGRLIANHIRNKRR